MSRVYDFWEKLVDAVLDREELRRLALRSSPSSSFSDYSSRLSFDSTAYPVARPIELKEIIKATENFQPAMIIGEGSMCRAFRAWIDEHTLIASNPGSGLAVAVKKWQNLLKHQDWLKETDLMVQLSHPNLVNLIAYCTEKHHMMLVYEFMPNGKLKDHLFTNGYPPFPWARRIKIALDIARGLSYLHERDIPIIHRDFNTASILLDWELNAKLSNYCYGNDDPIDEKTRIRTTQLFVKPGYTAPEYTSKGQLTTKSNMNMDERLGGQYPSDEAYEVVKVALKCLNLDPKSRPKMSDVVAALEQFATNKSSLDS